ncbi:MAG: hypothetical protein HFJ59_02520 [Clostridia bacterium]|nr:hypothetical protein [Clostridia bacterium]
MWEMKTKILKELYDNGYYLTGEYNRVDIINPNGDKSLEIFFFGLRDIRIRKVKQWWTTDEMFNIFLDEEGEVRIQLPEFVI